MNIKISELPKSQVEIEIELSAQEWDKYLDLAAENLSKELKIDGFRVGKAPRQLVEAKIGSQKFLEVAADLAVRKKYVKAVLDNGLEVIGQPEISILKIGFGSSFVFKAKAIVLPKVDLVDYKKIAKEIKNRSLSELEPTEKDLQNALDYIRRSRATRQNGEAPKPDDKQSDLILPELDDAFAKSLGDFENLDVLKQSVSSGLKMENQKKEKQRWRIEVITKIANQSKMDVPEILLMSELDKMVAEFKENLVSLGMEFAQYLEQIKKTEEDLKKDWCNKAEERVKTALTLRAIADKENIEAAQDEVEKEVNRLLDYYTRAGQQIDIDYLKEYTRGILKNERVFQLLEGCRD